MPESQGNRRGAETAESKIAEKAHFPLILGVRLGVLGVSAVAFSENAVALGSFLMLM